MHVTNSKIISIRCATIEDKEKLADKIDADNKSKISDALTEAQDWLNSNDNAEKDDFEEHQKELQRVCYPIIGKIYKNNGGKRLGGSGYDDEEFEDL